MPTLSVGGEGDYRRCPVGVRYRRCWPANRDVLARYCAADLDSDDAQVRRYMDDLRCKLRGHHDAHSSGSRRRGDPNCCYGPRST